MKRFVKRLRGGAEEAQPVEPRVADGRRLYCIGDIHGRFDCLQQLQRMIEADSEGFSGQKVLIYLGDYIDRGEQSRQVIDWLVEGPPAGFGRVCLLGNHEATLLDFLRRPQAVAGWLAYGGRAMLRSYGIEVPHELQPGDLIELRDELAATLPESHLEFLRGCELLHIEGGYCFVHAGIRPGIPLQEQRGSDLLWIRDEFLHSRERHEYLVVHGHTISEDVQFRDNRIGIDTGAFYSGVLTCLVLEGGERRLLQTGKGGDAR